MPKIPIIQAERTINASINATAQANDFAPLEGLAAINRTGAMVSDDLNQYARYKATVDAHKRQQDNISWVTENLEIEKQQLFDWMSRTENNSKESFAVDASNVIDTRYEAASKGAPNPEAAKMFKNEFLQLKTSLLKSAIQTSESTRLNNRVLSLENSVSNALQSYRASRLVSNVDSEAVLTGSLDRITTNIDQMFGTIAPETAKKLKTKAYVDGVYASMDYDPVFAKQLLDKAVDLDEHQRWTITNQIEQSQKAQNAQGQIEFDLERSNVVARAQAGESQQKIPIERYRQFHPEGLALRLKTEDDIRIDTFNTVNDWITKNAGKNPQGILSALSAEKEKIVSSKNSAMQKDVYDIISQQASNILKMQEKDPVSWMTQYHPAVKTAFVKYNDARNSQYAQILRNDFYRAAMKFQGPPPSGLSKEDSSYYLDLPTHARRVLSVGEAESYAAEIEKGSPSEVINRIGTFMANFQDPEIQAQAFNDLVNLPTNGIRQEYQFAMLNRNAPWINEYLTTIQGIESMGKISVEEKAKYENAIDANPTWMNFARTLVRDDMQRLPDLQGFRNGILSFAQARSFKYGESPKQAIEVAAKKLIGSELGFSEVNGVPIFAMRRSTNNEYRDEEFFKTLGTRLETALALIDPSQINLEDKFGRSHFPVLSKVDKKRREELLKLDLLENGFFQPAPDGQSVSLYYHKGDQAFQLRDHEGRAFVINLDDLPDFKYTPETYEMTTSGSYRKTRGEPVIRSKYDKSLNATNWPSLIQRKEVK